MDPTPLPGLAIGHTITRHDRQLQEDPNRPSFLSRDHIVASHLDTFSFQQTDLSRKYSFWDSPIEEIAPDSTVVSTQDLANLASQFRETNIQTTPSIEIPSRTSSLPLSAQFAHRRHNNLHDAKSNRRTDRQSMARLQSRLEKISDLEKLVNDNTGSPEESQSGSTMLPRPLISQGLGDSCVDTSTSSTDSTMDPNILASYRRTTDLEPKNGYVRKQIRLRKNTTNRRPLCRVQKP